ncbi:glycosyltransferase family 4 protein [Antarcticibacterium sp. 1MA-6-2]|uniref:glycosyltransferase family 4 protein n=1 Tax=Antarcticibacterium sp. 1MA-6-2 TaxID=2908210 RepID=UPI001F1DE8F7|nr:glycosyltransferase family 4 protein [Antarcticibacterium sp. 1MA-6-2]UJH91741.1 glycosyltransferase family 4 protein [Antarcticibacterium sp. 1MA-6-2]
MGSPLTCLFVGDAWFANLHGIQWFIDNVLDKVDIRLQIAGKASEVLKQQSTHEKIEYLGFVPNLSTVIIDADIVLAPIFKGGGMKVKICEALMFGKHILGTEEAFNGYEIDLEKVGAVCNTEIEFVNAINKFSNSREEKFNEYNRNCFLNKYSFQATYKEFNKVLFDGNQQQ